VVCGSLLLARHLLTLPTPAVADPVLRQALAAERHADQRDRWLALHVLAADCPCSQRVLGHLLASRRPLDVIERVVLVVEGAGPDAATRDRLAARGFDLDVVTAEQLVARYHVEVAPLLVVVDPHDDVRYVGGYTARKQAADVRDLAVIAALRHGGSVDPLPAFGCAIGRALRAKLDPLGIQAAP
jgi:hypothetical protein